MPHTHDSRSVHRADVAGAVPRDLRRPRVVATDLDGTLLRSDGTASERTGNALRALQAQGIHTVLVTARPPRWLDALAPLVGDGGVALCGDGAFVYDVRTRKVLSHKGEAGGVQVARRPLSGDWSSGHS